MLGWTLTSFQNRRTETMDYNQAMKDVQKIHKDFLRGVMDSKEAWEEISKYVYMNTPTESGVPEPKCTCIIRHAISEKEQAKAKRALAKAKKEEDGIAVQVAIASLQECLTKDNC